MRTIKLRVSEKVLDKVLRLFGQFSAEDLEMIETEERFESDKAYVHKQYQRLLDGSSKSYTIEGADQILERSIRKHEG